MYQSGKNSLKKTVYALTILLVTWVILTLTGCQKQPQGEYDIYSVPGIGALANSYIIASEGEAAIIDPGQTDEIIGLLEEHSLSPKVILLTHGHFDHIAGVQELLAKYPGTEVKIHSADDKKLADPDSNVSQLFGTGVTVHTLTTPLKEGLVIKVRKAAIKVYETPGHTSGSVSLLLGNTLFSGDTLMKGAVGRTDFPDGNAELLTRSLEKLLAMPDGLNVLPGHGEPTTIGEEKESNPFLN